MKKISIIIFLMLLSVFATSFSAFAEESAVIVATTEGASALNGDEIELSVALSKAFTATAGGVELVYDNTVLEFVSASWLINKTTVKSFDVNTEKGVFYYSKPTEITGEIFSARFKVRADAKLGESTVAFNIQLDDSDLNRVTVNNVAGTVKVTEPINEELVNAFKADMSEIVQGSMEERYNAIIKAARSYNKLNNSEKEAVSELYIQLQSYAEAYNNDAERINAGCNVSVLNIVSLGLSQLELFGTAYEFGKRNEVYRV